MNNQISASNVHVISAIVTEPLEIKSHKFWVYLVSMVKYFGCINCGL